MMINDMKKNELTEQEMENIAGGRLPTAEEIQAANEWELENEDKLRNDPNVIIIDVGAISDTVSTAWEVVKYAFELCG